MTIKLQHIAVALVSALIIWGGNALVALSASDLINPRDTLISLGVGLANAIGVALLQGAINEGFAFELKRPAPAGPAIGGGEPGNAPGT